MGKKNRCKPYKLQNTWNMPNIHNRNFFSSLGLNKWTYNKYWVQLLDLTLALFKYNDLPDTIDPRFMELVMIAQGSVLLSEDPDFKVDESDSGHIATMWNYNGSLNIYGIPNKRHAWAYGGYNRNLTNKDSVIMYVVPRARILIKEGTQVEIYSTSIIKGRILPYDDAGYYKFAPSIDEEGNEEDFNLKDIIPGAFVKILSVE